MKISLVIPAYNEEALLPKCLESVVKCTREFPHPTEIIVVNNASTDRTAEVAAAFEGVTVLTELRKGLPYARQAGLDASTGDIIANIDADVVLPAKWLPTVYQEFSDEPKLVGLSGPYIYENLPLGKRLGVRVFYYLAYLTYLLNRFVFRTSGMLQGGNYAVRKTAMLEIGGYDPKIAFYGEDTDTARKLKGVGKVKFTFDLPMVTSPRRLEDEGLLWMGLKYTANYFWIIVFRKPLNQRYKDIREN